MGVLNRIRNAWRADNRNYQVLVDANESYRNVSGVIVNAESAMRVAAVHACVLIISESVANLPLELYRRKPDGSRDKATSHPLSKVFARRPNSWQTAVEWKQQNMLYVLLRGNAVNEIKVINGTTELHPIHPSRIRYEVTNDNQLRYIVRGRDSKERVLLQNEVLHIRGPSEDGIIGQTPIENMANLIGASIAGDQHSAATWKNGARPGIVLQTEQTLPPNAADTMRSHWERLYGGSENSGKTAVLDRGLKAFPLSINHADLQFIEQQKMNATQIASIFRIPPHMIGLMDSTTFGNVENQSLSFAKMTLTIHLERIEQACQRDLIEDDNYYAEFNREALLKGDSAARAAYQTQMFGIGSLSVNEIRRMENLPPVEGGDAHFVNMALNPLEYAAEGIVPSKDTSKPDPVSNNAPADPEDDPVATDEAQAAARSVWHEQIASLVRWECDAITRAAKKPATFLTDCESFIYEHQERMATKLATAERVCRAVGVDVSATVYAAEHRAAVWSAILKASEVTAAELPAHVDALCESLKERARNG